MVAAALSVTDEQRAELTRMAGSSTLPYRRVRQAKALLWAAEGVANKEIASGSGGVGRGLFLGANGSSARGLTVSEGRCAAGA